MNYRRFVETLDQEAAAPLCEHCGARDWACDRVGGVDEAPMVCPTCADNLSEVQIVWLEEGRAEAYHLVIGRLADLRPVILDMIYLAEDDTETEELSRFVDWLANAKRKMEVLGS